MKQYELVENSFLEKITFVKVIDAIDQMASGVEIKGMKYYQMCGKYITKDSYIIT